MDVNWNFTIKYTRYYGNELKYCVDDQINISHHNKFVLSFIIKLYV